MARELPPRARRIPDTLTEDGFEWGTTSACAENTSVMRATLYTSRNYLRVRGEYYSRASHAGLMMELPPRARRIHFSASAGGHRVGTTSACAENTLNELGLL